MWYQRTDGVQKVELVKAIVFLASISLLGLVGASPAHAAKKKKQDEIERTGPYLGVAPGARDNAPGKQKVRSRGAIRYVTWVGFQMTGAGGRVFIQSSEPPVYNLVPGANDEVVIVVVDSRLHSYNDGRALETGWFPTAVLSVDADQMRNNITRVTIKLREIVGYDLRQEGNYLILDFRPPTKPIVPPKLNRPDVVEGSSFE